MDKSRWEYKKLGEVGVVITGNTPSTKDCRNYDSEDYCFVKPSDILKDGITKLRQSEYHISDYAYQKSRKLPKGSVLTTCIGIIGKVGILQMDATCNQQINAIVPLPSIDSSYLAYTILSSKNQLEKIANAPVVPIINKKEFSNLVIPVPSLPEQQHIVEELDLLSSIIEKKKAQLFELDNLAQSLFYEMFGDPITNEKGWEKIKLENLFKVTSSKRILQSEWQEVGIPFYKVADIVGLINAENISPSTFIKESTYKELLEQGLVPCSGDILITSRGTLGQCYIVSDTDNFYFQDGMITWLSQRKDNVLPIFIKCLFVRIPLPPLSFQQQFASKIEAIEHQKELIKQSIKEVETLYNSRMDYYFN